MDFAHLLKLIAALSGHADTTAFAQLQAGGADPAYPVTIEHCMQPLGYEEIEGRTVICGTVNVPENHDAPDGRRIELKFAVLKASSSYPEPDPLVQLHGGPGGGLVDQIAGYAQIFDPWRKTRDIVLFDQRAAGLSGSSVACYQALGRDAPSILALPGQSDSSDQAMADCIGELQAAGVDLAAYNTTQNALDVSSIVKALGYHSYNLYGISYGTKLALEVMRSAPEGLRAVIIDGVVPAQVKDYDTTAVPADEATHLVTEQCAADAACNAAYPDLGRITRELLDKAAAGTLILGGTAVPPSVIVKPILARNGQRNMGSLTPYIPAYIYEIYRGTQNASAATPTIDMLDAKNFTLPAPDAAAVTEAASVLPVDQRKLVADALSGFAADIAARTSLQQALWDLFAANRADAYGPIVQLFDAELTGATKELAAADGKDKAVATLTGMVADYIGLQNAQPSREALLGFVDKYFTGASQSRLRALIEAMRESEIEGSFQLIGTSAHDAEADFLLGTHLALYACQESIPFNSPAGFAAVTPTLHFPGLAAVYQSTIDSFFGICAKVPPQPRQGFHDPVVSDIPTLAIGSAWDVQTASSWAALAASTLANGQSVLIPEAGHGAVLYQPCVADMGVAFINNPMRRIDDSCARSLTPTFYIAPWVGQAAAKP
ncbi:MAG: TAP-like family protein [Devosia sp.]|uniref:alpha/beta fold hydrolase n=1 Tax=Devosia sp. TaxID=1871048 RepID=UPI0026179463|nr:alpha/beta hydrolase [Devosia sp.]MDB5586094.1 TAP-like family protein [Devosia sp.]